jgi:hypothetical protein
MCVDWGMQSSCCNVVNGMSNSCPHLWNLIYASCLMELKQYSHCAPLAFASHSIDTLKASYAQDTTESHSAKAHDQSHQEVDLIIIEEAQRTALQSTTGLVMLLPAATFPSRVLRS